jgi:hypothetical protein
VEDDLVWTVLETNFPLHFQINNIELMQYFES